MLTNRYNQKASNLTLSKTADKAEHFGEALNRHDSASDSEEIRDSHSN